MKLPIGGYYPRDIRCYKLWDGDLPIPQHDAAAESDWSGKGNAVHSVKTLVHDGDRSGMTGVCYSPLGECFSSL